MSENKKVRETAFFQFLAFIFLNPTFWPKKCHLCTDFSNKVLTIENILYCQNIDYKITCVAISLMFDKNIAILTCLLSPVRKRKSLIEFQRKFVWNWVEVLDLICYATQYLSWQLQFVLHLVVFYFTWQSDNSQCGIDLELAVNLLCCPKSRRHDS